MAKGIGGLNLGSPAVPDTVRAHAREVRYVATLRPCVDAGQGNTWRESNSKHRKASEPMRLAKKSEVWQRFPMRQPATITGRRARFALVAAVLALGLSSLAAAAPVERVVVRVVSVIDGDSIRVRIGAGQVERVRLMGLDAPELGEHARCPAEAHLAERARMRLLALLASGPVELQLQHGRDRYGRLLALVTAGGVDVAARMIGEGLARPYAGRRRLPWC